MLGDLLRVLLVRGGDRDLVPGGGSRPGEPASDIARTDDRDPHGVQRLTWLNMVRVLTRLPTMLDARLARDAGLSFFEYHVLPMLSELHAAHERILRRLGPAATTRPEWLDT